MPADEVKDFRPRLTTQTYVAGSTQNQIFRTLSRGLQIAIVLTADIVRAKGQ